MNKREKNLLSATLVIFAVLATVIVIYKITEKTLAFQSLGVTFELLGLLGAVYILITLLVVFIGRILDARRKENGEYTGDDND